MGMFIIIVVAKWKTIFTYILILSNKLPYFLRNCVIFKADSWKDLFNSGL